MNLLLILGILFVALIVVIPLLERFAKPQDDEKISSMSRWILPLIGLLAVMQLVMYMMGR